MSSQFDFPFDEPEANHPRRKPAGCARERQRTVLTVSDLTANIRDILENAYSEVWVEAEISNCRLWNTGHLYFTLKDPGAQIKAVMFRSDVRTLKFKPEDGLHVIVRGRISVYEPKGEYQIVCERMEPHGLGALQLAFDQLKRRLQAEGLFDAARKRALPALPRKIGIVTSLDGAAIRDIIKVLGRRYPNAHLVIRPARVQGDGAAADVARGIRDIVKVPGIDVVIVGTRRRIGRRSVGVQRRSGGESHRRLAGAHHLRRRARSGFHDCRFRRRRARADTVGRRRNRRRAERRFLQPHRAAERSADGRGAGLARAARIARASARIAGRDLPAGRRVSRLRGRHCAETTHALRHAARSAISRRLRAFQTLRLQLEQFDLRRRLGTVRARLVSVDGSCAPRRCAGITAPKRDCIPAPRGSTA